jgi:Domain of unknown function (DUF4279)
MTEDPAKYDDEYPTCELTHVTLRIYHETASPEVATEALGLDPDEVHDAVRPPSGRGSRPAVWLMSSEGKVDSLDVRRHLDWILDRLSGREEKLANLRQRGFVMDVLCRWDSIGQGGPMLSPAQMGPLAKLGLTVGFDLYS